MSTNIQNEASRKGNHTMPRVKVRQEVVIALPEEARRKLGISEGDELDIEVVEDGVLLKPVAEVDRAWDRILEAPKSVRYVGPEPRPRPEEEEEWLAEEVKAARLEEHAQGRR
jgi:AbrB family looped-hinge helix DNA binding protein